MISDDEQLKRMMKQNQRDSSNATACMVAHVSPQPLNVAAQPAVEAVLFCLRERIDSRSWRWRYGRSSRRLTCTGSSRPCSALCTSGAPGFNMVAFHSWARCSERVLGKGNYLALYFVGGIIGNAVSHMADVFMAGPT